VEEGRGTGSHRCGPWNRTAGSGAASVQHRRRHADRQTDRQTDTIRALDDDS